VATAVFASSLAQINFLVPAAVVGRQAVNVQIVCAGVASQPVSIPVAAASPAIFTAQQSGSGQAAIVNQDGTLTPPSPSGAIVTLYGTGFGVGSIGADGLTHTLLPVTALIGGEEARVLYAGEAPGYTSGLQQINILIPMDSPTGEAVPLRKPQASC
jgi:uncharacterized protein (TIGR03437 family)